MPTKRIKRNADGSESYIEVKPAKKAPKRPAVFKAGKWNPETELIETDLEKSGDSSQPDYSCCKLCNLRNVHRAVHTGNAELLRQLVLDSQNIANLVSGWSVECQQTVTNKILERKSLPLLEALFPAEAWNDKNF